MDYQLPVIDFGTAVSLGLLAPNYVRAFGIGFNPNIDIVGTPADCWGGAGLFNFPPVGGVPMQVRSTDPADTALGTGMRTVNFAMLDPNYNALGGVSAVSLNGTTPVVLASGANIQASNGFRGTAAGSFGTNVGDIILEAVGGGTIYGIIKAGVGVANQAPYIVPAGFTLVVPSLLLNVNSPGGGNIKFASMRTWFQFFSAANTPCAIEPLPLGVNNGYPYPHPTADAPIVLPEKTKFSLRITVVSDNATAVTAGWNGFLRKNT